MRDALIDIGTLVSDATLRDADYRREEFQHAEPFSHVAIDEFLSPAFAQALVDEFPKRDDAYQRYCVGEDGRVSENYSNHEVAAFPEAFKTLDKLMRDEAFLSLLSQVTGIPGLIYDAEYFGGGIRESSGKTFLPPHIDFNHHPRLGLHRRLNLLIYLNHDWDAEWGGNLQVHRNPREAQPSLVHSYTPIFNRALIFETSETSWHGFDRLKPPRGRARRAFTIYFYTKDRPGSETIQLHNTEYVEPALPDRFIEGYTLTAEDLAALREAYARRDGRIAMLYAMRREFDARFRHVWDEYEYYLNEWKKATSQNGEEGG